MLAAALYVLVVAVLAARADEQATAGPCVDDSPARADVGPGR